jgi:hypothetical protein
MALIDQDNVIFYHPLDDTEEFTQSQNWTGDISFVPGKVVNGAAPTGVIDNITFTSGTLFDQTGEQDRVNILPLDEDTALIHYGGYFNYSMIVNISGTTITSGTKASLNIWDEHSKAFKVSYSGGSGYALLVGYDPHPARHTQVLLVSISGTTLTTVDTQNYIVGNGPIYTYVGACVFPDGEHALFIDDLSQETMIVTISGDTLASGVTQSVAPAAKTHDVAAINNSGALTMFQTGDAYIANCDFDNDTITFGSGYSFSTTLDNRHTTTHTWSSRSLYLYDNRVLLVYRRVEATYGRIAEVSGTTITYGDEVQLSLGDAAVGNDWTTNHIELTQLSSGNMLFSYLHELDGGDRFLKYRILTIDGTTITVRDERTWETNRYLSNIKALSPSSILGGYRDGSSSSNTDVYLYTGVPTQEVNIGISGTNYPSTSGLDHISTAMWAKNPFPTSGTEEILMEFGYYARIRPSSILLGDDTTFNFVGSLE